MTAVHFVADNRVFVSQQIAVFDEPDVLFVKPLPVIPQRCPVFIDSNAVLANAVILFFQFVIRI